MYGRFGVGNREGTVGEFFPWSTDYDTLERAKMGADRIQKDPRWKKAYGVLTERKENGYKLWVVLEERCVGLFASQYSGLVKSRQ